MVTSEEATRFVTTSKGKIICCNVSTRNGRVTLEKCMTPEDGVQYFSEIHIQISETSFEQLDHLTTSFLDLIKKHAIGKNQVSIYLHCQGNTKLIGEIGDFLGFCKKIPSIVRCRWYAK
jgi:hypothetical protein